MAEHISAIDDSVYYSGHYWNNFDYVYREINRRVSGDEKSRWYEHFRKTVGGRRFKKALILNCGNGWVERELYQIGGLFDEAVGLDFSERLLDEARQHARDLPFRYYQGDINQADFVEDGYDLVVNHAACHHIAYIDRVMQALCAALPEDGFLVGFDYVGPHRNQYPYEHWNEVWKLNNALPQPYRKHLRYPHLKTMLATDPTEAIHSELILNVTARYFDFTDHRRAGGALAYEILNFNKGLVEAEPQVRDHWVKYIMDRDLHFAYTTASYFDYYACRPRKAALVEPAALKYAEDEVNRERQAARVGGAYYEPTVLQHLYDLING